MGCLLIVISAVLFFVFPPLGIAVFFIGLAVMVMNRRSSETAKETAKQTAELKRIALLSAPPEVQKAEAEKAQKGQAEQKRRRVWLVVGGVVFFVFVCADVLKYEPKSPASSGSPTPKAAATATTSPTPVSTPKTKESPARRSPPL